MYKSTFKHTTGRIPSLPNFPDELQGCCLICHKKFKAYKETKFNTDYCNIHWDKKRNKNKKVKKNDKIIKHCDKSWQSIIKDELKKEPIPYEWKIKILKELRKNV